MKLGIYKNGSVFAPGCFVSERATPPAGYASYAEFDGFGVQFAARSVGLELERESSRYSAQVAATKVATSLISSSSPFTMTFRG